MNEINLSIQPSHIFAYLFSFSNYQTEIFFRFFYFYAKKIYFDDKRTRWISITFFKKLILYSTTMSNVNGVRMRKFYISLTYFFSAFSFADSEDNMGREKTIFIPLSHIYTLTNIQTFICSFASEMTT